MRSSRRSMAATGLAMHFVPSAAPSCTLLSGPATRSSAACRALATCVARSARGRDRTPSDIVLADFARLEAASMGGLFRFRTVEIKNARVSVQYSFRLHGSAQDFPNVQQRNWQD